MMQGECGDSGRQRGSVESSVERPTSVPCGHLSTDKVPAFVMNGWRKWEDLLISCAMKLGSLFDPSLLFLLSLSIVPSVLIIGSWLELVEHLSGAWHVKAP